MRRLLKWLSVFALMAGGFVWADRLPAAAVAPAAAAFPPAPPCCEIGTQGGRAFDAATLTCVGFGNDCPGIGV